MELQQAEGKIMPTFIRSKCFVKFFVYALFQPPRHSFYYTTSSSSSIVVFFFSFKTQTATGSTSAAFCPDRTMALPISSESNGCE